jgi:hypothetical protein
MATLTDRRDWDFAVDGDLDAMYVEMRTFTLKTGPSAGKTKVAVDFHHGPDDELVSVIPATVLASKFREELQRRNTADLEPGERIKIHRHSEKKESANGFYWDFDVEFEYAAPKPTAAEMLGAAAEGSSVDEPSTFTDLDENEWAA